MVISNQTALRMREAEATGQAGVTMTAILASRVGGVYAAPPPPSAPARTEGENACNRPVFSGATDAAGAAARLSRRSRPFRHRPRHRFAVDADLVDLLVEEGEAAGDLGAFGDRLGIVPGEVGPDAARDRHVMISGDALVGAARLERAGREDCRIDILARQIVAGREVGLEEEHGAAALGHELAADHHLDQPAARQRVDALARVAGMDEHLLVLLEP